METPETKKQVTVIQADPKKNINYAERDKNAHKRVGAYCRVSTESDEQLNSYDQQVQYWNKRIETNPNYTLVKIYTDRGISGTSAKNRTGFMEMMADAKAGKLDLILTKSISRFARNTALTLDSIKKLKEWGVEVFFDEENMSSLDPKNEAMFTIMSSMAQEESRHISENVKWTFHKKMKEGWDFTSTSRFLGYDKDPETKQLVINEEEAKIVREIFDMYTAGYGPAAICRRMEEKGYKTGAGKTKWCQSTVQGIIKNEKYKGDLMLQKTVTLSYLDHKRVDNNGHATKYYIENSHPPIVSKEQWQEAQDINAYRAELKSGANKDPSKYNARYPMSARLICMQCGAPYKRRQWVNGSEGYRFMYQCTHYITPVMQERCKSKPVSEKILMLAACEVINRVFMQKDSVFAEILKLINEKLGSKDLTEDINKKLIQREGIDKQLTFYLDQKAKSREENEIYYLNGKYQGCLAQLRELDEELEKMEREQMETENVQNRLKKINELLGLKEIVPEMLTNDIMDAFIYKILIVDKRNVIFCINTSKSLSLEEFIEKRKEFLYSEPIIEGTVKHEGTQRLDFVNYKVVSF